MYYVYKEHLYPCQIFVGTVHHNNAGNLDYITFVCLNMFIVYYEESVMPICTYFAQFCYTSNFYDVQHFNCQIFCVNSKRLTSFPFTHQVTNYKLIAKKIYKIKRTAPTARNNMHWKLLWIHIVPQSLHWRHDDNDVIRCHALTWAARLRHEACGLGEDTSARAVALARRADCLHLVLAQLTADADSLFVAHCSINNSLHSLQP